MLNANPKQRRALGNSEAGFAYYAGYSSAFVEAALDFLQLKTGARIVDPWNGSGTTTEVAARLGFDAFGYDLNPAAVLVARARLLRSDVRPSHRSLAAEIVRAARRLKDPDFLVEEPLQAWFSSRTATAIRSLERSIQYLLLDGSYMRLGSARTLSMVSPLASQYYVALFRTVRRLLQPFRTSNPTWTRLPSSSRQRLRTSREILETQFQSEVESLFSSMPAMTDWVQPPDVTIDVGDSKSLSLLPESIDGSVSSPPYCTRIDYAVSMRPELAILATTAREFRRMRLSMLGSTIMSDDDIESATDWGPTCQELLSTIHRHPAHGSGTYYYRTHQQYFSSLYLSLGELARVLRPNARAVLVAQDSYYKEAHNDLPRIIEEMCSRLGLGLERRFDHSARNTKAAVNTRRLQYRRTADATESVLVFCRLPSKSARGLHVH